MLSRYSASRSPRFIAVLCGALTVIAGCGGGSGDIDMDASVILMDGAVPENDAALEGPHVVSTTPASGAQGVSEDTVFVFVFSETMDTQATQAAYESDELPAADVDFQWNDAGDQLTVIPSEPLPYAEGDELVEALAFGMRITTAATNAEGDPLAEEATLEFSTLRRIVVNAPLVASTSGRVTSTGVATPGSFVLGDGVSNTSYSSFVTFSLDSMPNTVTVESARLEAPEITVNGDPDDDLGQLVVQHVYFEALDADAYGAELLATTPSQVNVERTAGELTFSRGATVTAFVQSDIDNRNQRGEIPEGTVKSRLHRARALLREVMAQTPGTALPGSARLQLDAWAARFRDQRPEAEES